MIGNADAEEEEHENVRTGLRLTGDRFDGFARHDAVADRRAERDAGDDKAECQQREGCN